MTKNITIQNKINNTTIFKKVNPDYLSMKQKSHLYKISNKNKNKNLKHLKTN